ncbi:MAG: nuclear transport factor 2 family protein [Pseudomonadota bacterium]
MADFLKEKQLVRDYYAAIEASPVKDISSVLSRYLSEDHLWRGYHPFYEQIGFEALASEFWSPFLTAVTSVQRRVDIFFAGYNVNEAGGTWVVSMGHLLGLFDTAWLGIRPTGKIQMLRYCEFMRVENDRITETAFYIDIPHFMAQAGCDPFPPQTGAHLVQPGPQTNDGILYGVEDDEEGKKTVALINAMVADIGNWQSGLPLEDELRRTWHEDMLWWGPHGIGSTFTIERYAKQHAGPFRASFANRKFNGHVAKLGEGSYGAFFGWPNFRAEPTGGFMGMPATGKQAEFRVIDVYRRDGDKLAENWIFIDLLYLWKQFGVDILERAVAIRNGAK